MRPRFSSVGPLVAASTTNIRAAAPVAGAGPVTLNGSLVSGGVATLDTPRRVILTTAGAETALITLVGTNWTGQPITENIQLAGAATYQSVLDYATLTSVTASAAVAGNLSIGTNGVASSAWVQFDDWLDWSGVAMQLNATGTVNNTIQQTLDNPNATLQPGQLVAVTPQNMVWINSADTNVVAATSSQQSNYQFAPVYCRILLNSGTGSVSGTFVQNGK